MAAHDAILEQLLQSEEPSVRWKARVDVLGEERSSPAIQSLEQEIRESPRVRAMLQHVQPNGELILDKGIYAKWQGAQWVLINLADIGYPRGDAALLPIARQLLDVWLGEQFFNEWVVEAKKDVYKRRDAVPLMQGRHRTCASQQGNTLYVMLALGLQDERLPQLVERLLYWQWPDGGWNCDKEPSAHKSTFIHTLWSMRALALYAQQTGDQAAAEAARRASEIFLKRHFYKRESSGKLIREEFVKLHYPLYWHYDILAALKVFAEIGFTEDPRANDALDLLESKRLPDGGWPAEAKYYKVSQEIALGNDYVDWGGTSSKTFNPWVTADALYVLRAFARLQ